LKRKGPKTTWVPRAEKVLQLKIVLLHIKPPIWRRVLVPDNYKLGDLHAIIQTAMGWNDSHMHAFRIDGREYASGKACEMGDMGMENEDKVALSRAIARSTKGFVYEYDFGDSWMHEIVVEKILPLDPAIRYPLCLAGARACPPEDCGSVPGYYEILRALRSPRTQEHRELLEWLGEGYDPNRFDVERANRWLTGKS
jgi:hypothetical protein